MTNNAIGEGHGTAPCKPWGSVVLQHQHAFMADDICEITLVARRALSALVAKDGILIHASDTQARGPLTQPLFDAAVHVDPRVLTDLLATLQASGHSGTKIAFDVLPDVARQLGTAWEDDTISFTDVTVGCARLQRALHHLTDDTHHTPLATGDQRDCLVIVPKGAQHTFGAMILAKQLRYAGMRVTIDLEASPDTLSALAKSQSFHNVFMSASLSETSDTLCELTRTIHAQWPDSKVILGGTYLHRDDSNMAAVGADHVTQNLQDALGLCI